MAFEQFVRDMKLRPHRGLSLERKDPTKMCSTENCIWADDPTQRWYKTSSLRCNVEGDVMNLADLARAVGSTSRKVRQKIDRLTASGLRRNQAAERIMADWRLTL